MNTNTTIGARAGRRPAASSAAVNHAVTRLRRTWRGLGAAPHPAQAAFDVKFVLIVERSRRGERPFAVTRFVAPSGAANPSAWARRFVTAALREVRACDAVGIVGGRAVVVWDDSDRPGAAIAAKRLVEAVQGDAEIAATVAFPDDGYTPAALFRTLDEQFGESLR